MTEAYIRERLAACGVPCNERLPERLKDYLDLLLDWNTRMNLTRITDPEEAVDAHFVDSLMALTVPGLIPERGAVIDVGTGAGFPGLVLALACPDLKVTLLDSLKKRLDFLQEVINKTGADNVTLIHARAEDGARKPELRERFDYATARALAPTNVLCEYLLPFVKIDGCALCWKGPALKDELESGRRAAHLLGGRMEMPVRCSVEGRDWEHLILPVRKIQKTASVYPRKAGTPKNKPLGM